MLDTTRTRLNLHTNGGRGFTLDWGVAIPAFLLLLLIPIYSMAIAATPIGMMHDDGIYVVTGQAIAAGHGFNIDSYPAEMRQTKYPIVLPLVLAGMWRLNPHFPENIPLLKSIPILALFAWGAICFHYFRRHAQLPIPAILWILVFVATNPWSLFCSSLVLSETLFAALALASLAVAATATTVPTSSQWRILASALLAGAAYQTRTAGVAVIVAIALWLLFQRRFRQAALFLAVTGVSVLAWMIWQRQVGDTETSIEAYYTAKNYTDWSSLSDAFSRMDKITVGVANFVLIWTYPSRVVFAFRFPAGTHAALPLLTAVPFWILFVRGVRRAPSVMMPAALFILLSSGMLMLWVWPPERFLLPILPLLLLFVYYGLPAQAPRWVLASLVVLPVLVIFQASRATVADGFPQYPSFSWAVKRTHAQIEWRKISRLYEWIKQNAAPDSVILANDDPAVYLYTGRKSIRPFKVDSADIMYGIHRPLALKIHDFERISDKFHAHYLLETASDDLDQPDYSRILDQLKSDGRIKLLHEIAPQYRIWEISNGPR